MQTGVILKRSGMTVLSSPACTVLLALLSQAQSAHAVAGVIVVLGVIGPKATGAPC